MLLVASVVAVLAAPTSAAVDPATLVLRQADVPSGVRLIEGSSGHRSNADRMRGAPAGLRVPLARFGRVTGYDAVYARARPYTTIISSVDIFRRAEGLDGYIAWWERKSRTLGQKLPKRTRAGIGVRAWVTTDTIRSGSLTFDVTTVSWRHGRVSASVVGAGLRRAAVLSLARKQQQRIAAAFG